MGEATDEPENDAGFEGITASLHSKGREMTHTNRATDIDAAVDIEERRYIEANPVSKSMFRDAGFYLPGGSSRQSLYFDPFPLFLARTNGSRVEDADGHEYIDFTNDMTAALYGHSEPAIVGALRDALSNGMCYGGPHAHEVALGKEICERFSSIDRVRFCTSGTEANLVAMQLSTVVTGRRRILAFDGSYHGHMCNYLAANMPLNLEPDRMIFGTFNDTGGLDALARKHAGEIAAIIVEPMMGAGGGLMADRGFLAALRATADRIGAVLIFDEVQTARFAPGGLQSILGTEPDVTTLGKFFGGGLNFGAVGGKAQVVERLSPTHPETLMHGGTFNNNVLTMVAGYAGLRQVATGSGIRALNSRGDELRERLAHIAAAKPVPFVPGCYGSILSLHFQETLPTTPREIRTPAALRKLYHLFMLNRGVYISRRGAINLSFAHTEDDCDRITNEFEAFLDAYGHLVS
ncbi:MAG: aminotransferase class III-fold pyridoxal phosphate-dependent enzyme [Alphaproteobacteria bacterium]|nr:aminotransferase class III-fold pyridoxal phosphate-dependent enzyme [Alphaproteobacteria bacterium]